MSFDEALLLFDRLIEMDGYWMVRREDFLDIKRITDWYRNILPQDVFTSVEAYRKADLPGWEVASLLYEPKAQPAEVLAGQAMDSVPDNMARAAVAYDGRRVELKGIVYYVNRQLDLIEQLDRGAPIAPPARPGSRYRPGPSRNQGGFVPGASPAAAVTTRPEREVVKIHSLVEGVVTAVHKHPGDQVKAGDLILELDNAEIKLELKAAEVELHSARATLALAAQRYEKGLMAQEEKEKAEQAVMLAELNLERWALRLQRTQFKSPVNGRVLAPFERLSPGRADASLKEVSQGVRVLPGDVVVRILPAQAATQNE